MKENIMKLLKSETVSNYKISKDTGIIQSTLSGYATGKSKIGNMKLDHAITLNNYYLEEMGNMEKVFEEIKERIDTKRMMSDGIYIDFYENAQEYEEFNNITLQENLDDRGYSERETFKGREPFILLEDQSATDGNIYTGDATADDIVRFMKSESSYKKYIR